MCGGCSCCVVVQVVTYVMNLPVDVYIFYYHIHVQK